MEEENLNPSNDETSTETDLNDDVKQCCEPCSTRNIESIALQYCQDCDEKFCDTCTASHQTQKATKGHTIVDIKHVQFNSPKKECEPCSFSNKSTPATCACEDCEEFLCAQCKTFHLSQKQNKHHNVISILDEVLCEPCKSADKRLQASGYCLHCEDPEPLCHSCVEQHTAMKLTRGHELSYDIANFILRYKSKDKMKADPYCSQNQRTCEPCTYRKKSVLAAHYCKECEEFMCDSCISQHRSMKNFSQHDIVNVNNITMSVDMCEPCKYDKKERQATHKCEECDEYLCGECKTIHLSQKMNRNHPLKQLFSSISCDNCSANGCEVMASVYCKDCDSPLCDSCAECHSAMKRTRGHVLSKDLTVVILSLSNKGNTTRPMSATNEDDNYSGARPKTGPFLSGAQNAQIEKGIPVCEPCSIEDSTVNALFFCEECDENLCEECFNFHQAQTETRQHKVTGISRNTIFCKPCRSLKREHEATSFCIDCHVPDPLCDACAHKHTKMKLTKYHRISSDISQLHSRFPNNEFAMQTLGLTAESLNQELMNLTNEELGKPYSSESKSDSTLLQWRAERELTENEVYQIILKEHPNGKWRPYVSKERCSKPRFTITGLKANTSYIFKVKIIDDSTGKDGQFTEESDPIHTRESPALGVLQKAEQIESGPPKVYQLPIKENISARNKKAKTRKFFLGKEGMDAMERTVMIVGATGSGKSTLINGMANYIMGVTWEDSFRFTLINLEACEQAREHDQAHSQTEWVTCYTIHNDVSDRVNYTINLIDTPGFGDTRGLEQDAKIIEQIRELFNSKGERGVATLDAVCFILKAPDARLTTTQKYIFEAILSLFGNDIKDNICTLITFADGQRPPVLAGIQAIEGIPLPYDTYFTFNNSALFVDNTTNTPNNLSSFFWDMGIKSCQTFFDHLTILQTKSLSLTTEVLRKRQKVENTVIHLQQEIEVGLSQINVLEKEVRIFSQNEQAILQNKNFEYLVDEDFQEKIDLTGKGQYTTNCLTCNYTCHESCAFPNDSDKAKCCAMNREGSCVQCPKGCHWKLHHNTPYIIKWSKRQVKKRYDEMKKKYEEATKKTLTQEQVLEQMNQDISRQEEAIQVMMEVISKLNNRLKEIALRPDPMSTVQYMELMIASEKREKKSGFEGRIDALEKCKKRATYGKSVKIFQDRVRNTRQSMAVADVADEILKDDKSVIGRIKGFFGVGKK
ncbi:uncharacterized protein [Mytilus edulis]|uniref:uncharacterized protein n=1 Tax=Mytilus edulis TaxID=6550 RepID=UPI0039EFD8CD